MTNQVYFNHDAGVDDLVSLLMLLQSNDKIELIGIGDVAADSYLEPGVSASQKLVNRFGSNKELTIAASIAKSNDPFPKEWRMDVFTVDALPILNEFGIGNIKVAKKAAHLDLIDKLMNASKKVDLLFTGPLSDLAMALDVNPEIEQKINRLYWMGGTFGVGNIAEPEQDNTAEWNAFWDPIAVKRVWDTNIEIDMVGLESTHQVPLTNEDRLRWAKQRKYVGLDFIGQGYANVPTLNHFETNSTYFLWDVLTTAHMLNSTLTKTKVVKCDVITSGKSRGRVYETDNGRNVNFVYDVNHDEFFDYLENIIKRAK